MGLAKCRSCFPCLQCDLSLKQHVLQSDSVKASFADRGKVFALESTHICHPLRTTFAKSPARALRPERALSDLEIKIHKDCNPCNVNNATYQSKEPRKNPSPHRQIEPSSRQVCICLCSVNNGSQGRSTTPSKWWSLLYWAQPPTKSQSAE